MQSTILETLLKALHIFVCAILMFVVLLQQGRGGGMGAAFGGGAAAQVFGGRGAGNILTRATTICATIFMLTSVSLAYLSSSGDRAIKVRAAEEARKHTSDRGAPRDTPKSDATPKTDNLPPTEKPSETPSPSPAPGDHPTAPAGGGGGSAP